MNIAGTEIYTVVRLIFHFLFSVLLALFPFKAKSKGGNSEAIGEWFVPMLEDVCMRWKDNAQGTACVRVYVDHV